MTRALFAKGTGYQHSFTVSRLCLFSGRKAEIAGLPEIRRRDGRLETGRILQGKAGCHYSPRVITARLRRGSL